MKPVLLLAFVLFLSGYTFAQTVSTPVLQFKDSGQHAVFVQTGSSRTIYITIRNRGSVRLSVDSFDYEVSGNISMIKLPKGRFQLDPGHIKKIPVVLIAGNTNGHFEATIYPVSNAGNSSTVYYDRRHKNAYPVSGYVMSDTLNKGPFMFFPYSTVHDFGTVTEGPQAEYSFGFVNKGSEPLIIQRAQSSCGCLTSGWPKEPVMPGKKGIITASYYTMGRIGPFCKTITVVSNDATEPVTVLTVKGTVVKAPERPGTPER
jgi:hypothetical protein